MKIAHIAPPWISIPPKNYGGTELVIYNLVEEQIAQGHDVTLLAPGDAQTSAKLVSFYPKSLLEESVPWHAHLKAYYHMHKAVEYIKAHDFDIVHTHLSSRTDMSLFPLLASLTTPHITTLHSNFPFDQVEEWVGDADHLFMEWASHASMVAVSDSARAKMPSQLNCVGVVHLGVSTKPFCLLHNTSQPFLLWLGRFAPEKGPHLAIQAAKHAAMPLILAGTLDRYSQKSLKYFDQDIKPFIDDAMIKYVGPVNMDEKRHLFTHAAAFLNPIEWDEPGATALLESMGLGCPVLSFARGVAPELIVHGKTGFLVRDVDEMARFIHRIGEINREVTRRHVERHFSTKVMAEKYVKIYKQVISGSNDMSFRPLAPELAWKRLAISEPTSMQTDGPAFAADAAMNMP